MREEAAAVSLCGLTAAQALWYRLGLEAPVFSVGTAGWVGGVRAVAGEAVGGFWWCFHVCRAVR